MGVNLGGGNIGVAEHDLNRPKIGATFEEMTGKGVAQAVGRYPFFQTGTPPAGFQ